MTPLSYHNFDLVIEPADDADIYRTRVLHSPVGPAVAEFQLPLPLTELNHMVQQLECARDNGRGLSTSDQRIAAEFGGALHEAVFQGNVGTCLIRSRDAVRRQRQGVRIRLHLRDVPALAALPWEYLYDGARQRFLAQSVRTPLVRYFPVLRSLAPLSVMPPLNMLIILASPRDRAPLNVEKEWWKLNAALAQVAARGGITITRLAAPTLPALQQQLRGGDYHILHFTGHGCYDAASQRGTLFFEDEQGQSQLVSSHQLGMLLYDHAHTLRLCLLNTCEGARTDGRNPFAGVAPHLVQQGVPAVIAMQSTLTDGAATTLTQEFYGALADGYPVDGALAEARKAIYTQQHSLEWATPVLYLVAEDGHIFGVGGGEADEHVADARAEPVPHARRPSPLLRPRRTNQSADTATSPPRGCFLEYGRLSVSIVLSLLAIFFAVRVALLGEHGLRVVTQRPLATARAYLDSFYATSTPTASPIRRPTVTLTAISTLLPNPTAVLTATKPASASRTPTPVSVPAVSTTITTTALGDDYAQHGARERCHAQRAPRPWHGLCNRCAREPRCRISYHRPKFDSRLAAGATDQWHRGVGCPRLCSDITGRHNRADHYTVARTSITDGAFYPNLCANQYVDTYTNTIIYGCAANVYARRSTVGNTNTRSAHRRRADACAA